MLDQVSGRLIEWLESCFTVDELERMRSLPVRGNEYGYDRFGFHPQQALPALLVCCLMYRRYFRGTAHGIERLPPGRVMLVANHSGQLPFDAISVVAASVLDAPAPRVVRSMLERYIPRLPYLSYLFPRWGQVLGTPDNCRRLLEDDEAILVFPEGAAGISKPFARRYQLQPFGQGFVRLALECRTPILPLAIVGAEEQAPAINVQPLARLFGAPSFPIVPWPPFLPLAPLPARHHLYFGEPITLVGDPDDDDEVIDPMVDQVRVAVADLLDHGLRRRTSVFW